MQHSKMDPSMLARSFYICDVRYGAACDTRGFDLSFFLFLSLSHSLSLVRYVVWKHGMSQNNKKISRWED